MPRAPIERGWERKKEEKTNKYAPCTRTPLSPNFEKREKSLLKMPILLHTKQQLGVGLYDANPSPLFGLSRSINADWKAAVAESFNPSRSFQHERRSSSTVQLQKRFPRR